LLELATSAAELCGQGAAAAKEAVALGVELAELRAEELVLAAEIEEGGGLHTILPLPILYAEWQNKGGGGEPDIAQY